MNRKGTIFCEPGLRRHIFPEEVLERINTIAGGECPLFDSTGWEKAAHCLKDSEFIFATWRAPLLDEAFLAAAPRLRALFYAGGSVKKVVTDAAWEQGILVSSAWRVNAIPVSEYTMAAILLSLKRFWHFSRLPWGKEEVHMRQIVVPGAYKSTVGLISLGSVGRAVRQLLRPFDINVLVYDPYLGQSEARELGVESVSLEELFARSDVVSLHAPWIPETVGLVDGALIASMKNGATLINTARGAIIKEAEMAAVLEARPDLSAILDVTWPEPPACDSPLLRLPNVIITPHISGSVQAECSRMGHLMADELKRFLSGKSLQHAITRPMMATMA